MKNEESTKLINEAYAALDRLNDVSHYHHRDDIFERALQGERQHRRINGGVYYLNMVTAAKLFTVRWLTHYVVNPDKLPSLSDMLTMRDDVQLCAMVAATYREQILEALKEFDTEKILGLDYVALIEGRAP